MRKINFNERVDFKPKIAMMIERAYFLSRSLRVVSFCSYSRMLTAAATTTTTTTRRRSKTTRRRTKSRVIRLWSLLLIVVLMMMSEDARAQVQPTETLSAAHQPYRTTIQSGPGVGPPLQCYVGTQNYEARPHFDNVTLATCHPGDGCCFMMSRRGEPRRRSAPNDVADFRLVWHNAIRLP